MANTNTHYMKNIVAGVVVCIVVIPQSLGYALLAGLPPVYGLYAAIIPSWCTPLLVRTPKRLP